MDINKQLTEITNLEHDLCTLDENEESIYIECKSCIMNTMCEYLGTTHHCGCGEKILYKIHCKKCYELENKINGLRDALDKSMFDLSYNIKNYSNCDEEIEHLRQISQMLRLCNRALQRAQTVQSDSV